jgi:hypothetical protein
MIKSQISKTQIKNQRLSSGEGFPGKRVEKSEFFKKGGEKIGQVTPFRETEPTRDDGKKESFNERVRRFGGFKEVF